MGFLDKVKNLVSKNADKVDTAIDKAGDLVDKKTQGKYAGQVDKVQDAAKKAARDNAGGTQQPPQPPQTLTLDGDGKGGVKVKLIGKIKPADIGSTVTFDVHLGGPALFGPIGMIVASSLKSDIRESLDKFKTVFA